MRRKIAWKGMCCFALLATLLAAGCADKAVESVAPVQTAPAEVFVVQTEAPEAPSPTLAPETTPQPDMVFEEDGDILTSDAFCASFTARTFSFSHAPRVLIYHTHAREAFRQEDGDVSGKTDAHRAPASPAPQSSPNAVAASTPSPSPDASAVPEYRSNDLEQTVVHIGDLLEKELAARGFVVLHDRTNVEAPSLSTAYERSLERMLLYQNVDIYIDLHRNAANVERARNDVVLLGGERVARMFFVVGTGMTAPDDENAIPNWRENYTFALSVGERLAAADAALVKPIRLKQKTYNQQMGLCLLAEIGHNANLIADAEHTVPYLADALKAVCLFPS